MNRYSLAAIGVLAVAALVFFITRGGGGPARDDRAGNGSQGVQPGASANRRAPLLDRDLRTAGFDILVDDDAVGQLRLEGQVIDQDQIPVAGAEVIIDSNPPRTTTSEEDGSFSFDQLIGRPYTLVARTETSSAGPVTARLTATSEPVILYMRPAASVKVTVLAASDRMPLANATVQLRGMHTMSSSTDEQGVAVLTGVAAGFYRVAAEAAGYATAHGRIRVASVATSAGSSASSSASTAVATAVYETELLVRQGAPVSGTVRDSSDKPVEGAQVLYVGASDRALSAHPRFDAVVTGADGEFSFPALPAGTFRFTAQHATYAPGESEPITLDGSTATTGVAIVVEEGAVLAGRVVTDHGEPAPAAAVRVSNADDRRRWARPRQVYADADGRFEITGLARKPVQVVALHERATSKTHDADLEAQSVQKNIELVLELDGVIAGVVVDSNDEPVDGAQVRLLPDFRSREVSFAEMRLRGMATEVSDAGGRFEFRGLAESTYFVQASPPGSEAGFRGMRPGRGGRGGGGNRVEATVGNTEVRLVLAARGAIAGKVALPDGKPVTFFTITMGGFRGNSTPFASEDGSFRLGDLEPGEYQPRLSGPDFDQAYFPATEISEGEVVDVGTITVVQGRKIAGKVVNASGQAVANATVTAGRAVRGSGSSSTSGGRMFGPMAGATRSTTTDEAGEFTLRGLGATQLAVVAEHETAGRSTTLSLPATGESTTGLEIALQPPGAIAGTVLLDGKPADGARVSAQSQNVPSASFSVQAGSDGKYRFDVLAPDDYLVSARVGDPRSGIATESRATRVTSGAVASVPLSIERGKVTLVVSAVGERVNFAMVYLVEGAFTASNAEQLEFALARRDSGSSTRSFARGGEPARLENLVPGQYTTCVVPFPPEVVGPAMFEYLGREAARMAVFCKKASVAASPAEQELAIEVVVPGFVPASQPDQAQPEPPQP